MKAVLYVAKNADVIINSYIYFQNGDYVNADETVSVEILEI